MSLYQVYVDRKKNILKDYILKIHTHTYFYIVFVYPVWYRIDTLEEESSYHQTRTLNVKINNNNKNAQERLTKK